MGIYISPNQTLCCIHDTISIFFFGENFTLRHLTTRTTKQAARRPPKRDFGAFFAVSQFVVSFLAVHAACGARQQVLNCRAKFGCVAFERPKSSSAVSHFFSVL
jgi:hypothetical protein